MRKLTVLGLVLIALSIVSLLTPGSPAAAGAAGTSPTDAVRLDCGTPTGGSLPAGGRTWMVFSAVNGQTRGVSMWFGPLATDVADLTAERTPYFKVWTHVNMGGLWRFALIGAGTTRGPYWNAKTWRGAGDITRDHYVEVINSQRVSIDYTVTLDCRWPI